MTTTCRYHGSCAKPVRDQQVRPPEIIVNWPSSTPILKPISPVRNRAGVQADLAQNRGKAEAVQQAETEDHQRPPDRQLLPQDVFDRDPGNRHRDQRLDDLRRHRDDLQRRQRQRHRMGQGEGGDLRQQGPQVQREEEQPQHEQDVVQPLRQDMR